MRNKTALFFVCAKFLVASQYQAFFLLHLRGKIGHLQILIFLSIWERNMPSVFAKCLLHLGKKTALWFAVFRISSTFRKSKSYLIKFRHAFLPIKDLGKKIDGPQSWFFLLWGEKNLPSVIFPKCLSHLGKETTNLTIGRCSSLL